MADAEAENYCSEPMLVVLVNNQSKETLKLLVNFQIIRKSICVMD